MLSKRYVPTQIESLNYEEKLVKHYRKLEEIQKEDRKKKNVDKEVAEKAKFTESREKAIKFHISERTNAIEKDNELLLGRLVEISRKKPGVLAQVKSETNLPRTLNGPSRRREKNRIAAENEAFARRLLSQQPSFNPKKLEVDYEKHHQRVKNMAKHSTFSPRKVRLPPIKYADFDNTTKDGKKSVKNAKKDQKKKNNDGDIDVEVDDQPKEVSPVKVQGKEVAPIKLVVTDSHIAKDEGVNDSQVDNKPVEKPAEKPVEKPIEEPLNKPAEDQKQPVEDQKQSASVVNVDNKSQVLQDNQVPKSGTDQDQKIENNSSPNSAVVDQKSQDDKPVEESVPNEQIQDDTKEATA